MNPIPATDYLRILPELVLTIFGVIVMMADPLLPRRASRKPLGIVALIGAILSSFVAIVPAAHYQGTAFFGMVNYDAFAIFFHVLIGIITVLVILASYEYLDAQHIRKGEYYGLILFGAVGMMLMSSATELVLIFIALVISAIARMVLAGVGIGGAVYHTRQHRCAAAEQYQAPAGLLFHRSRGISAGGIPRSGGGATSAGNFCRHLLHRQLCGDERWRLLRGQPSSRRRRAQRHARRLRRTQPPPALARGHAQPLPAFAYRHSCHRRLLRQILRFQRGSEGEPGRHHDHRSCEQRHRGVLLPARYCGHVHARRPRRSRGAAGASLLFASCCGAKCSGHTVFRHFAAADFGLCSTFRPGSDAIGQITQIA